MMRHLFWLPLLVLAGIASTAHAQSTSPKLNLERAKKALTQTRRHFLEGHIGLSDAQKDAFWTIYNAYEEDLAPLSQQANQLGQAYSAEYSTLTNARVMELMKGSGAINKKAIDLRYKFAEQIGKKVGPKVGARFFQLDEYYTTVTRMAKLGIIGFVGDQK